MSLRPSDNAIVSARPDDVATASPLVGLRMVRIEDFEPAVALGEEELAAYLRRCVMLFADDATMRRGGIGRVTRAVNAQGEAFALKQLVLPAADELDDQGARAALVTKFKAAFREEYECHRALSGLKGFPRLFGWGMVDGVPSILMEWVEGETLSRLRSRLAVDDARRLSPLTAARLARDIFDLLCRMNLVGEGFVHRDISPANIMVRTARIPLERQLADGVFDLCLIDFGSSLALEPASSALTTAKKSFTERYATLRRATVAYAPPEMLSDDLPDLAELRTSPAIDVYAAASVVYELLSGAAPFEEQPGPAAGSSATSSRLRTRDLASPYRLKMDTVPEQPLGAHEAAASLADVIVHEPDVAVAAAEQARQLGIEPGSDELRAALVSVDGQLADIVMACLAARQDLRPPAADVEAALVAFCENYHVNVGHALRGEPLAPCPMAACNIAARRVAGIAAASIAGVLWLSIVVSAAWLAAGSMVTLALGAFVCHGCLPGIAVVAALALPGLIAVAASATATGCRRVLMRGALVLCTCELPVLALAACLSFSQAPVSAGLLAAAVSTFALVWFILVLGLAFELPAAPSRRSTQAAALMGGAAAAHALGGPDGNGSSSSITSANS